MEYVIGVCVARVDVEFVLTAAQESTVQTILADLEIGEVSLDAIPWYLHEEHAVTNPAALYEQCVQVAEELLVNRGIIIAELRNRGFVKWPEQGSAALKKLLHTHTDPRRLGPIPTFGWSEALLFLFRPDASLSSS